MNIILVCGANARARTIAIDWRHLAGGALLMLALLVGFTVTFNVIALKWAAAARQPWLQAIVLADQREAAARVNERVQAHLNAMAVRLGELQARMARLDGLGERLARGAGLKPQDLPGMRPGSVPGRGGAPSSLPSHDLSLPEFSGLLDHLNRDVDARDEQFGALEGFLIRDSARRNFLPSVKPVADGWFSSNFGYRIDPFTGQSAFHEGIDFPAETGTAIVAAASGKVVFAGVHPQYGRMIEIDHGNGLVTRYAHASQLNVKVGALVVRGQRVATVGSTGRSTGPHLHFEVRLNGVPQNPARFLRTTG
ncbi:MAG TPA: M23 family metallopeptidase [Casimicrobiaceae bacterium]